MAAQFKNLDKADGLAALNTHLATRSYIEGYSAGTADVEVFAKVAHNVDAGKYPHVARWFNHIQSFSPAQRQSFGGAKPGKQASSKQESKKAPAKAPEPEEEEDDDSGMSFDDMEDAAPIVREKEVEKVAEKKDDKKKAAPVGKSTVILDVKPMGSETDMAQLEKDVRAIEMQGLKWLGSELVPVAYGVKKLRIIALVVDDEVSIDDLQENLEALEECQSTDIYAFNKV